MSEARYAIYFVPGRETPLYRFGAQVLGYDVYTGEALSIPSAAPDNWSGTTREPRVYGFHATLKPPFRLAASVGLSDLEEAFDAFARSQSPVQVGKLELRALSSFIALIPAMPCPALNHLADSCVRQFDRFRAPMTEQERSRRLAVPLSSRQKSNLELWGYPHVFEDFRFHMTLTGSLAGRDLPEASRWLSTAFADRPEAHHLSVDRVAILRQDGGAFTIIRSALLGG